MVINVIGKPSVENLSKEEERIFYTTILSIVRS